MSHRRGITAAASAVGVGYSAWLLFDWGPDSIIRVVSDIGLVFFALFAAVCSALAAYRRDGRERAAWLCMTLAAGGWAVGGAGWSVLGLVTREAPLPGWANIGYLVFLAGAALCLVFLLSAHSRRAQLPLLLDGVIIAAALFGAAWVIVLGRVYEARSGDPVSVALSLVYPVGDIVLIAIAVLLLVRAPAGRRPALSLLTGGLALIAVSDTVFAYFAAKADLGGHQEGAVGWALGFLSIGLAALFIPSAELGGEDAAQVPSRATIWLPYAPVVASAILCTPILIGGMGPVFIAAAVTVFAVMIRQFLVIGENRRLLVAVADQALRDPLTGLASRALFTHRLEHAVALQQRQSRTVAVLLLDLDHFRLVNDSLGHPAGDDMLVRVSDRLVGTVRGCDTVARLDGDEFAVLMDGDVETCGAVADRVVQAFERPFLVGGRDLLVRPSVGLAILRGDADGDDADVSADELLRRADVAMNTAKNSRSSRLCTFSPEMGRHPRGADDPAGAGTATVPGAAHLLGELRHAIEHFELCVFYQPKYDIRRHEIVGLEALIRWPHPRRGLLAPDEFLPLVRQHGLMRSMTTVVLELALDDAARWYRQGVGVPVAVNVFAPAISDPLLPDRIAGALKARELGSAALAVEITEDLLLDNLGKTRTVLENLRANGVRVAIDDFGSGYSALWYLREFPVDEIKLDRQFVAPVLTHPASAAIVRSVVELAHTLNITPVAEGVENAQTARRLLEFGCEVAQGFHYSPPLPASAVLELLLSQKRRAASAPGGPRNPSQVAEGTRRSEIELMQ